MSDHHTSTPSAAAAWAHHRTPHEGRDRSEVSPDDLVQGRPHTPLDPADPWDSALVAAIQQARDLRSQR